MKTLFSGLLVTVLLLPLPTFAAEEPSQPLKLTSLPEAWTVLTTAPDQFKAALTTNLPHEIHHIDDNVIAASQYLGAHSPMVPAPQQPKLQAQLKILAITSHDLHESAHSGKNPQVQADLRKLSDQLKKIQSCYPAGALEGPTKLP